MDSIYPFSRIFFFAVLCINLTDLADSKSSFAKSNVSDIISKEKLTIIHFAFNSGLTFC